MNALHDDATLVRTDLERRLETTVEENEFLKRCHGSENINKETVSLVRKDSLPLNPMLVLSNYCRR